MAKKHQSGGAHGGHAPLSMDDAKKCRLGANDISNSHMTAKHLRQIAESGAGKNRRQI